MNSVTENNNSASIDNRNQYATKVDKSQISSTGVANSIVQLDNNSTVTASGIYNNNGSVIVTSNQNNQQTGSVGTDLSSGRGTFLYSNGADKIKTGNGAAGVVELLSSTSVTVSAPLLSVSGDISATGIVKIDRAMIRGTTSFINRIDGAYVTSSTNTVSAVAGLNSTVSVTGNDFAGKIDFLAGTSGTAAGAFLTVNFKTPFTAAPFVQLTPATTSSVNQWVNTSPMYPVWISTSSTGFTLNTMNPMVPSATYSWFYMVVGYL
jgi:hypothetical protein